MDVAAEITATEFSEVIRTHFGLLYLFFSKLCENHKETSSLTREENTNNYINKAIEFIQNNYHNPIKVSDIANYVCLNRSYLSTVFQNKHISLSYAFCSSA